MSTSEVRVRVPGSTSNLGSGFDTLGLTVQLYQTVELRRRDEDGVRLVSVPKGTSQDTAERLVREAATLFFKTQNPALGIEVRLGGDLPVGRGLGASAAARVGVLVGLNELCRTGLTRTQLLELATELEGHPDNASPALLGGFTVSGKVNGRIVCQRYDASPRLCCVTLIPHFEISTAEARRLLPSQYPRPDAAHALNRAALITAAFASSAYETLTGLFDDRFHQPYREALIPSLPAVIKAGVGAGAIGGFLSGSGSAIMCLTLRDAEKVAEAMSRELPESEVKLLDPDNDGARM